MKIVIVGYGPGGAAAAVTARMFNSKSEITLITEETLESHRKPGATMALEFPDTPDLRIEDWSFDALSNKRITTITGTQVTGGDSKSKVIQIMGPSGKKTLKYDQLILATGGIPAVPKMPGTDLAGVFTIQTMADTSEIGNQLSGMNSIVIVGAGFSGLETAERLLSIGKDVHIIIRSRLMRTQLEEAMSLELQSRLPDKLTAHVGKSPSSVVGDKHVEGIVVGNDTIPADAVLFMTGVRPNTELAKQLGVTIGQLGGIVVDEKMKTSVNDIFAVGDCVEMKDSLTGKPLLLPIGSVAARAGRQAGVIAAGGSKLYDDSLRRLQYDRLFDTDIVVIGHSTTTATSMGLKTDVQYIEDPTEFAKVALVTSNDGRLIGGQVISSRMGARLGYEVLERVETGSFLKEKPLLKPRHERLREYLEATFGPIR
ncbi:MAG: NAD(P)/FAD-dependent oxidoreductase [Candidatus Thorarchaeota archaeon]